jgi:hypothetical protein
LGAIATSQFRKTSHQVKSSRRCSVVVLTNLTGSFPEELIDGVAGFYLQALQ